jgi:dihydrofolate reductase
VLKLTGGKFPQAEIHKYYVITQQKLENKNGITFYNGDLEELITNLKSQNGKNIYCDGGAQIVKLLMDKNLIDEYIISVIPTILGDGKRLFKGGIQPIGLKALPSKHFDSGLVQLHYVKKVIS